MSRVLIDVSALSLSWFKSEAWPELANAKGVVFLYSEHAKYSEEVKKTPALLYFLKLMGEKGRRLDVDKERCENLSSALEANAAWKGEGACDDPHLFSIVHEKPSAYVFTSDHRIAKCRNCIRRHVSKEYCKFKTITRQKAYSAHRRSII